MLGIDSIIVLKKDPAVYIRVILFYVTRYMHAQAVVRKPLLHSKPMTTTWSAAPPD